MSYKRFGGNSKKRECLGGDVSIRGEAAGSGVERCVVEAFKITTAYKA